MAEVPGPNNPLGTLGGANPFPGVTPASGLILPEGAREAIRPSHPGSKGSFGTPLPQEEAAVDNSLRAYCYRRLMAAFVKADSEDVDAWSALKQKVEEWFLALEVPDAFDASDNALQVLRGVLESDDAHTEIPDLESDSDAPTLLSYFREMVRAPSATEAVARAFHVTAESPDESLRVVEEGFVRSILAMAANTKPVPPERVSLLVSSEGCAAFLTEADHAELGRFLGLARPPEVPSGHLTRPSETREADRVDQHAEQEPSKEAPPAGDDLRLKNFPPIFRQFAAAHPDEAREFAAGLMQIAEECGGLSKERILGLREAARRISEASGKQISHTTLRNLFLSGKYGIGEKGPDGNPLFSPHECSHFTPPDLSWGGSRKKKEPLA